MLFRALGQTVASMRRYVDHSIDFNASRQGPSAGREIIPFEIRGDAFTSSKLSLSRRGWIRAQCYHGEEHVDTAETKIM